MDKVQSTRNCSPEAGKTVVRVNWRRRTLIMLKGRGVTNYASKLCMHYA